MTHRTDTLLYHFSGFSTLQPIYKQIPLHQAVFTSLLW